MARNRGKKALYEVMSKARLKPGYGRTLEQMRQKDKGEKEENKLATKQKSAVKKEKAVRWSKKPRVVQFNVGRIEFSTPYPVIVAFILGIILLGLAVFQLGQYYNTTEQTTVESKPDVPKMPVVEKENPIEQQVREVTEPQVPVEDTTLLKTEEAAPDISTGSNVIVLAEYATRADLEAAQKHFAENGIELEIVMEGGRYFLQTKNKYDNPGRPGTDGYEARKRIIEVGAKYKAPSGYESFAPNFFSDAYGKRVK